MKITMEELPPAEESATTKCELEETFSQVFSKTASRRFDINSKHRKSGAELLQMMEAQSAQEAFPGIRMRAVEESIKDRKAREKRERDSLEAEKKKLKGILGKEYLLEQQKKLQPFPGYVVCVCVHVRVCVGMCT
jgi:hypothetical protein